MVQLVQLVHATLLEYSNCRKAENRTLNSKTIFQFYFFLKLFLEKDFSREKFGKRGSVFGISALLSSSYPNDIFNTSVI